MIQVTIIPDSEVEGVLVADGFVFIQDFPLCVRSVQNDRQVAVILNDSVVILSPSSFGKLRRLRVNSAKDHAFFFASSKWMTN
jgi:hypothetical protein